VNARLLAAARGDAPFDLLLAGATLVDVATGELRAADVGIVAERIASVHPRGARRDAAEVLELPGRFLAPGFIDSHMHVESSLVPPAEYAAAVLPAGTTTIVWDPHELANVCGLAGVAWARDASRGLPLRVLLLAPSCVPSAPGLEVAGAQFDPPEIAELLSWPEMTGLAEVMDMAGVIAGEPRMAAILAAAAASGKRINGHARGLSGPSLQAFCAAGITSDHEITSGEDLLQKLRAGLTVELRGSHDFVLPGAVAALSSLPALPPALVICTDDVLPDDLLAKGGLRDTLARIIARGMAPVSAIRCATLHAALRLGRTDIGIIAPGRIADIAVLSDLPGVAVEGCIASGRVVAWDGAMRVALPRGADGLRGTMKLAPLPPEAFLPRVKGVADGEAMLPVVLGSRFTTLGAARVAVRAGVAALPEGLSLLAVIHRHGRADATPSVGLVEGWGELRGAIATSLAHDSHNLLVFGRDPADMAAAANAVIGADGGMAVAQGGAVTALLPLPIAGLLSDAPLADTAAALARLRAAAGEVMDWLPPHRVFRGLTGASLACNPGPRVTDRGIADGATRVLLDPAAPLAAE
jgi:adenine deaminase